MAADNAGFRVRLGKSHRERIIRWNLMRGVGFSPVFNESDIARSVARMKIVYRP